MVVAGLKGTNSWQDKWDPMAVRIKGLNICQGIMDQVVVRITNLVAVKVNGTKHVR